MLFESDRLNKATRELRQRVEEVIARGDLVEILDANGAVWNVVEEHAERLNGHPAHGPRCTAFALHDRN